MRQHICRGWVIAVLAITSLIAHNTIAGPQRTSSSRHVREFLRLARSELKTSNTCVEAVEYLHGLPLKQQLSVARSILNDPDANIGYHGANILIKHGYIPEAVPALAAILASGRDQTQLNGRFTYDWVHSDDNTLALRMMIRINRYLLANLSKYTGEERRRVEDILMRGLLEKPSEGFSIAKAEERISEWEAELTKLRAHRKSG